MLGALAQLAGQTTMPRGGAEAEADGSTAAAMEAAAGRRRENSTRMPARAPHAYPRGLEHARALERTRTAGSKCHLCPPWIQCKR